MNPLKKMDRASKPVYSIVIPVRHGVEYLSSTLLPLIESDRNDFEVIIVVNNLLSSTKSLLDGLKLDERFKVFYNSSALQMSVNYEYSISLATGDWILLLGADDSILEWFFEALDALIVDFPNERIFKWRRCYYFWDNASEIYGSRVFEIFGSSRRRRKGTRTQFYKSILGLDTIFEMPQLYTCSLIRGDLVSKIRQDGNGSFYHSIIPDVYSSVALMLEQNHFISIGIPLTIVGTSGSTMSLESRIYREVSEAQGIHARLSLHTSVTEEAHSSEIESIYLVECLRQSPKKPDYFMTLISNLRVAFDLIHYRKKHVWEISRLGILERVLLPGALIMFLATNFIGKQKNKVLYFLRSRQSHTQYNLYYTSNDRSSFKDINSAVRFSSLNYAKTVRKWLRISS